MNDIANLPATVEDPRIKPVAQEVATLMDQADTLEVATADDYERGAAILMAIKAAIKDHKSQREEITKPLDKAKKSVMDLFRPFATSLANAEITLKKRLVTWKDEQDRIAREEARKADEKARREREKLEAEAAEAEAKGRSARAETLRDRAVSTVAAVPVTEAPKVSGIATSKAWKFRIVDALKVPDKYKLVDEKKIGGVVRAMKGDTEIPGVEVWEESTMAARSA